MNSRLKRQQRKRLNDLVTTIQNLETSNKQNTTQKTRDSLFIARQELRTLLISRQQNRLCALKANSYRCGNKAGKLLANQLKDKITRQKIQHMHNPKSGKIVSNPKEIADSFSDYYESLYNLKDDPVTHQPSEDVISDFLASISLPKLSQTDLTWLNLPFTIPEIDKLIRSMPHNKSSGPDGYSSEYYQLFHTELSPYLKQVFDAAISKASLPQEMLTATIITLPKPGKDPSLPQNFRPISLLNVDVKIYAKLIANRLSILLPKLINQDQVGFVSGRQANDATRRMINIIHSAEKSKMPSLLLTLDAEKAFDRVHWGYLVRVLEKFNTMGPIQKAIRALYSSPSAYVYTEGMFSKNFQITNGTRQGCPLSPLIFALIMEPLAEKIRTHPEIQGISSRHQQHRISLFADNVILTLSNPYQSLRAAHDTLAKFSEISYYKVNASKSNILGIAINNPTKTAIQHDIPYPWAPESIPYLGVQLTSSITKLYEANYFPLISKIQQELSKIQKHYLTWGGHLAAYKMLISPKLTYFFRALPIPIPTSFFTAMQKQLLNFVWAGKRARFPVSLQRLHKSVGGLGTPSLKDYYMAAILDQLKGWFEQPTTKPWCQLEQSWLFPHTPRSILIAQNLSKSKIVIDHPTIQASLYAWSYLKETTQANLHSTKVPIPLSSLHWLISNISLGHWLQGDTLQLKDITKDDKLLKFSDIQNKPLNF